MSDWPSVGVVIGTHDGPETLRQAIEAARTQRYPGRLGVVVVYDRGEPDLALATEGNRPVWVIKNSRTPGMAGARNSGIRVLDTELVAFCADNDVWLPGKLAAQVSAMDPQSEMTTCAVNVRRQDHWTPQLAGIARVRQAELLRCQMKMPHSSTFLLRRKAMLGGLGMVAEDAPASQNADWDLLLRAARRAPIAHVDAPYANIHWGDSGSCFDTKISSLHWMLGRHPELHGSRAGAARVYAQLSCWHAAVGDRGTALRWATQAYRATWKEPRAFIGVAAALGLVKVPTVLNLLRRRGHGI